MRRLMCGIVALAVAFAGAAGAQVATAPTGDDWDFAEDASRNLTVAAVRYETGPSIIVQCTGQVMVVALAGMPAITGDLHRFDATRADGMTDAQVWRVGEAGTMTSRVPSRDARFLRAGGVLRLRSAPGQAQAVSVPLDLPTEHANLDRVIEACAYPLSDDRDGIRRADPELRLMHRPLRGERGGRPGASIEVSCIVEGGAYRRCRVDRTTEGNAPAEAREAANDLNGTRLHPSVVEANEGRVVHVFIPLLLVVRE